MIELPPGLIWDFQLKLGAETERLTRQVWPNYLVDESDIPEPGLKFEISLEKLQERFLTWGIRRASDGSLVASGSALLIAIDPLADQLPETGWRYAIESVFSSLETNCFCLTSVNIESEYRGLGLAKLLIEHGKSLARERGLKIVTGPVRPTLKSDFPDALIQDYLARRNDRGEAFDPWLRTHVRLGAEVLNVCSESVIVRASLAKWREWTSLEFSHSGDYVLPGGLAPLRVDLDENLGTYVEPNVWVRYDLASNTGGKDSGVAATTRVTAVASRPK